MGAAACGADILALEVARELGLWCRVVLPFDRAKFRDSSVTDRGGDWGERYDRIVDEVEAAGDLIEFAHDRDNVQTFFTGNQDILDQAQELALELKTDAYALIVWNGESSGDDDVTGHFKQEAEKREGWEWPKKNVIELRYHPNSPQAESSKVDWRE